MGPTRNVKGRKTNSLLRIVLKTSLIHSMIFSLLIQPVQATGEKPHWVDTMNNTINSVAGAYVQGQQQSLAAVQMANQMQALAPQIIPAKFFPHCRLSQASTAFPENVCREPLTSPTQLSQATAFKQLAIQYKGFFEQLMSPAQNSPFPSGLQCLEEARSRQASQFQASMNRLQALADSIKKANQKFRDDNKQVLREMDKLNQELTGNGLADIDSATNSFANYFDDSCQNIIGQDALLQAPTSGGGGLNGLRLGLESHKKDATNYASDRTKLEKELDAQITRVTNEIREQGIDNWVQSNGTTPVTGQTTFAGMTESIQKEFRRMEIAKNSIVEEVQKVDPSFSIPKMDKNFGVDFEEFTRGADDFFRKKFVNECVTFTDQGVGLSIDQLLKSLDQRGNAGVGDVVTNYRTSLETILLKDSFIEDKISEIQGLENRFGKGNVTIVYKNADSKRVRESVYDLLQRTIDNCNARFEQDDTFAPSSTNGGNVAKAKSQQKQVERAKTYLNDLKNLEATFISDLTNAIREQVVNCNGVSKKANSCEKGGGVFNTSANEFCFAHANECSSEISACYAQVDVLVEQKKSQIKAGAEIYNQNVANFVASQEILLKQVQAQVLADAEAIKNFFPNSDFVFPEDLFVGLPAMEERAGVQLRGGGNLNFIQDLPGKISSLKGALEDQKDSVDEAINDYITAQANAMEDNRSKWATLLTQCSNAESNFKAAQAAAQQEALAAQNEQLGQVGEWCHHYNRLRQAGPGPGCEGDHSPSKLYGDSSKIVSHLSHDAVYSIQEYEKVCAYHKKDGKDDDDDDSEDLTLAQLCEKNNGRWSRIEKKLTEDLLANMPDEFSKKKSKIKKYLKDGGDLKKIVGKDLIDEPYASSLEDMRELLTMTGDSEDSFNNDLDDIMGRKPASTGKTPTELKEEAEEKYKTGFADLDNVFKDASKFTDQKINFGSCNKLKGFNEEVAASKNKIPDFTKFRTSHKTALKELDDVYDNISSSKVNEIKEQKECLTAKEDTLKGKVETTAAKTKHAINMGKLRAFANAQEPPLTLDENNPESVSDLAVKISQANPKNPTLEAAALEAAGYVTEANELKNVRDALGHVENLDKSKFKEGMDDLITASNLLNEADSGSVAGSGNGDDADRSNDPKYDKDAKNNLCAHYDNQKELALMDLCKDSKDGVKRCIKNEEDDMEEDDVKDGKITKANNRISSVISGARGLASLNSAWSAIGQQTSDACQATASTNRGTLDLIQQFDQAILNGGNIDSALGTFR